MLEKTRFVGAVMISDPGLCDVLKTAAHAAPHHVMIRRAGLRFSLAFGFWASRYLPACSSYLSPGYFLLVVLGLPTLPPHWEALQCPP